MLPYKKQNNSQNLKEANNNFIEILKPLLNKDDVDYINKQQKLGKQIPNGLKLERNNNNLPNISIFIDDKGNLKNFNASSFNLDNQKDVKELIKILQQIEKIKF